MYITKEQALAIKSEGLLIADLGHFMWLYRLGDDTFITLSFDPRDGSYQKFHKGKWKTYYSFAKAKQQTVTREEAFGDFCGTWDKMQASIPSELRV